jgi:hypothetical protein
LAATYPVHKIPKPKPKRGYSSAGALVMARTLKRVAEESDFPNPELMAHAIDLERRALDAIRLVLSELPEE